MADFICMGEEHEAIGNFKMKKKSLKHSTRPKRLPLRHGSDLIVCISYMLFFFVLNISENLLSNLLVQVLMMHGALVSLLFSAPMMGLFLNERWVKRSLSCQNSMLIPLGQNVKVKEQRTHSKAELYTFWLELNINVLLIARLFRLVGRLGTRKPVLSHQFDGCCYSNWPS